MGLLTPAAPYDPRRWVSLPPLGGKTMAYRIHDAATGPIEAGEIEVAPLRRLQPWAAA